MDENTEALLPAKPVTPCPRLSMPNPKLFAAKTLFIWAASFAFVPLVAADNDGRISAVVYAVILVVLHVLFLVIYFWRVRFRELDPSWRSLTARCIGLVASVYLLYLVAGSLSDDITRLTLDIFGLCFVHTFVLLLLTLKVSYGLEPKQEEPAPEEAYEAQIE